MKKVYDHPNDPVFIGESNIGKHLILQIGASRRGECRYVMLRPRYARVVAYMLLAEAERKDAELEAEKKRLTVQAQRVA